MAAKKRPYYADSGGVLNRICREAEDQHAKAERRRDADTTRRRRRNEVLGAAGIGLAIVALLTIVGTVIWSIVTSGS